MVFRLQCALFLLVIFTDLVISVPQDKQFQKHECTQDPITPGSDTPLRRAKRRALHVESEKQPQPSNDRMSIRSFNKTRITWKLINHPTSLMKFDVISVMQRAFTMWASASAVQFEQIQNDLTAAHISIQFVTHMSQGEVAHIHHPWAIHFNANTKFTTGSDTADGQDLFTVALHQIGHILGLAHSHNDQAVMSASYLSNDPVTSLTRDDIQAIRELYGTPSASTSPSRNLEPRTARFCQTGIFYCGRELMDMAYTNVKPNGLYECDHDKDAMFHIICDHGCHNARNPNQGSASCLCEVDRKYCGWQLRLRNFGVHAISDQKLYKCMAPNRVSMIEQCYVCSGSAGNGTQCTTNAVTTCISGNKYCGVELADRAFKTWKGNVLYQCDESRTSARVSEICHDGCEIEYPDSYCLTGNMARPAGRG